MRSSCNFPYLLLSLLLLVMLMMLRTAAQVEVSVGPANVALGLSPSLDVNCTFFISPDSNMTDIVTLTMSRDDSELVIITAFSDQESVISNEGFKVDGDINQGDESYIRLHWDNPTDTQEGTYQCTARGVDDLGHNIETTNSTVVNVDPPELQDLMNEVRQLYQMQTYVAQLEERVSSLEQRKNSSLPTVFVQPPLSYKNKLYYVSKLMFQDFDESIIMCKAFGGQLSEIDDEDEYNAIREYMNTTMSYLDLIMLFVGGTDVTQDGIWVLPSSNETLPVVDWSVNTMPVHGSEYNCLCLYSIQDWRMFSENCHWPTYFYGRRYLCEFFEDVLV